MLAALTAILVAAVGLVLSATLIFSQPRQPAAAQVDLPSPTASPAWRWLRWTAWPTRGPSATG